MTASLIVLFFVVLVSFLSSLLEAVFLSITPSFVALAVKDGKKFGELLEHLKENVDRPITAILTMNTITNVLGSAVIATLVLEEYGNDFVTVFTGILTVGILVFGEIVPKTLGAIYWKNLAPMATYFIQGLIFLMYPMVWLSGMIHRLWDKPETTSISREEMIAQAEMGVDEGTLHRKESAIIKNLLTLRSLYVSDIMTPRSVFFALESAMTVEDVHQKYRPIRFSRIPVYEGSIDHVIGMTMRYKIHEALSSDHHSLKVRELVTPIQTVPERMTVASLLDLFIKRKEHLFLAVDEYGIVTGLVSLEDAIETLLGVEIVDELDSVPDMRQYALDQWQLRKNQIRRLT